MTTLSGRIHTTNVDADTRTVRFAKPDVGPGAVEMEGEAMGTRPTVLPEVVPACSPHHTFAFPPHICRPTVLSDSSQVNTPRTYRPAERISYNVRPAGNDRDQPATSRATARSCVLPCNNRYAETLSTLRRYPQQLGRQMFSLSVPPA